MITFQFLFGENKEKLALTLRFPCIENGLISTAGQICSYTMIRFLEVNSHAGGWSLREPWVVKSFSCASLSLNWLHIKQILLSIILLFNYIIIIQKFAFFSMKLKFIEWESKMIAESFLISQVKFLEKLQQKRSGCGKLKKK